MDLKEMEPEYSKGLEERIKDFEQVGSRSERIPARAHRGIESSLHH